MSERERWIVYPLLFLALGAALRDKLLKQTQADNVVCKQIVVRDDTGKVSGVLNSAGLQTQAVKAAVVDAQRLQQAGRPVSAGSKPTLSLPLNQLLPLMRMLPGAGQPQAKPPQSDPPPSPQRQDDPPPTITIPVEPAPEASFEQRDN